MNRKYAGIGLIILFGIILWLFFSSHISEKTKPQPMKQRKALPKEVTVTLDKNGFSPKTVTINVGSAIRWKNVSGAQQTVNSDNYPTNQLHKELNFGVFANGSTVVYTFTKTGVYGYHNQFHHEQSGKVIVQ